MGDIVFIFLYENPLDEGTQQVLTTLKREKIHQITPIRMDSKQRKNRIIYNQFNINIDTIPCFVVKEFESRTVYPIDNMEGVLTCLQKYL